MLDSLKHFFSEVIDAADDLIGTNKHDIRVATCALFLELAKIDGEFSAEEETFILTQLKEKYHLDDDCIRELLQESEKKTEQATDLWEFTNLIDENYKKEEKIEIIELLLKLVFIDGKMDKYERYLIDNIIALLHISHKNVVQLRHKVLAESN